MTLCDSKMHSHTKFGIPTSNNIGKMLTDTQDRQCDYYMPPFGRKKNCGFIILNSCPKNKGLVPRVLRNKWSLVNGDWCLENQETYYLFLTYSRYSHIQHLTYSTKLFLSLALLFLFSCNKITCERLMQNNISQWVWSKAGL